MTACDLLARVPHPTAEGVEHALGGTLCRCTGYRKVIVAVVAANSATDTTHTLGNVGDRLPRVDGATKVSGNSFGADFAPENALTVKAIRPPHPHASFTSGDLRAFAARPGVTCVLTADDSPDRNAFGVIPSFADQPAIAASPARFRGECVAVVTFDHGIAPDLTGIPIEWVVLPALLAPDVAEALNAPRIHDLRSGNQLIQGRVRRAIAQPRLPIPLMLSQVPSPPLMSNTPISNRKPERPGWSMTPLLSVPALKRPSWTATKLPRFSTGQLNGCASSPLR